MSQRSRSSEARYEALLQLLRTADALWNASRVFFSRWELSPSQFNILNLLSDQPAGRSQIELGRLLITHRSNVTGLVDRLEKRRLVQRLDVATDRRAYRVTLTPGGRRLLGRILPEYFAMADRVWGGFPAVRAKRLAAELAQLSAISEKLVKSREAT